VSGTLRQRAMRRWRLAAGSHSRARTLTAARAIDRPYQAYWLGLVAVSAPFAGAKSGGARAGPTKRRLPRRSSRQRYARSVHQL
jgi:hypothetical protein